MAVARFGNSTPAAGTPDLIYTVLRTALISVSCVNLQQDTKISVWVVPSNQDENEENWIYACFDSPLKNRDIFETFKIAVNINDKIYVQSDSGFVRFFVNGIYDTTGTTDITVGATAPQSPQIGSIWINDALIPQETFYWNGYEWNNAGTEGPTGPVNTLTLGTIVDGDPNTTASVSITGPAPDQILNITLRQGPTGPQGTFDIFENAPSGPSVDEGDVWFNSADGRFYVRYDGYWVEALSNEAGPTGPTGPAGETVAISATGPITVTGPLNSRTIGFNETGFAKLTGATFTGAVTATGFSTTGSVTGASFSTTGSVSAGSGTITGELTARSFTSTPATTTTALNFATETFKTISIAADTTFTASNYAAGRSVTVRITSDGTQRALVFPTGWVFVGIRPTNMAANRTGILTITSFGTTEANCVAAWAVQQ